MFDETGRFIGYRGVGRHITERKVAEAEHRAHLWFLESMDRIHRSMQGTDHFQEMVNNVLGEVLDIFQCERVVLSVFGTRSGTAWYKRLAIKLRAGHDHRDRVGIEYVADEDAHAMRMEVRAAARPVAFVLGSVPPHIARVHAHFRTQSVLSISIEAKQERREYDHFYYLSIDQCSYARVWTADEMRLFEEIGRRLGDALIKLSTLADLQRRDAYLSAAQRLSRTASWAWDPARNAFVHWSRGWLPLRGPESAPDFPTLDTVRQSIYPQDRAAWSERFERALRERSELDVEYRSVQPDGTVRHIRTAAHPVLDGSGELVEFVGTDIDITEHHAHLWFLESMDRINRAMQGTNDLERMMSDVLDAVLEIFACDRAWLLYPCDPNAPSWRAVMERTRPPFPARRSASGTDVAGDAEHVRPRFAAARASARPPCPMLPRRWPIASAIRSQHGHGAPSQGRPAVSVRPAPVLAGAHAGPTDEQRLFRGDRSSARRCAEQPPRLPQPARKRAPPRGGAAPRACRLVGARLPHAAASRCRTRRAASSACEPVDLPQWHGRWLEPDPSGRSRPRPPRRARRPCAAVRATTWSTGWCAPTARCAWCTARAT